MEAKLLASLFSFLSIFLAIYADAVHALAVNVDDDDSTEFELETAIYFGDSNVNIGEKFSITCIIPVTDPINWTKDGEPITRHNLRHGRDEHSYIHTESHIEGEKHKIEANIFVRHALKVHEGKYQCNNLHTSYHILHVRSPDVSDANELSTLAGYESIYDLTPSSVELFSNSDNMRQAVAPPLQPDIGPLPLPTKATAPHNRQSHHHHHQNSPVEQRKMNFMNNTAKHYADSKSDSNYEYISGLMHPSEYMPSAANKFGASTNELTTVPWRMTPITRHGPPPIFPTPRTTWLTPTVTSAVAAAISPASPPLPHIPHVVQHQMPIYMPTDNKHNQQLLNQQQQYNLHQQQQQQQHHAGTIGNVGILDAGTFEQPRFPLQKIQTTHQHQQQYTQQPTQPGIYFTPVTTAPLNPLHSNNQQQQHQLQRTHPQQPQQAFHVPNIGTATSIPNPYAATTSLVPQPMAPALSPTAGAAATTTTMLQPKIVTGTSTITTTTTTTTQNVKETGSLVPNYDDASKKLKYFDIRTPLVLSCHDTESDAELTWEKNGTDVKRIKSLEGRYRIIAPERKFIIDRTDQTDDGTYSCTNGKSRSDIEVVARVVVRVPSNMGVVEGEKMSIVCTVLGTKPELVWVIGNQTIANSTGRYLLKADENHVENAILTIDNVSLDDRGEYKCIGRNAANDLSNVPEASDTSYVRVKGKLAALWPFLGICAEVLILCAIILIYEKRRNKSELEESDTDPQDQQRGGYL